MWKYSNLHFEGKHEDEKILYFCKTANIRVKIEILKIIIPFILMVVIICLIYLYKSFSVLVLSLILIVLTIIFLLSLFYKIYRVKNNYLYITSKRILFHWLEWFFKDYVKKINYENIKNINYFTESFIWRIFNYWTLEIQNWYWIDTDIKVYHINYWKMLTHYIDKLISLTKEKRESFGEFDPDYFKNWKN